MSSVKIIYVLPNQTLSLSLEVMYKYFLFRASQSQTLAIVLLEQDKYNCGIQYAIDISYSPLCQYIPCTCVFEEASMVMRLRATAGPQRIMDVSCAFQPSLVCILPLKRFTLFLCLSEN